MPHHKPIFVAASEQFWRCTMPLESIRHYQEREASSEFETKLKQGEHFDKPITHDVVIHGTLGLATRTSRNPIPCQYQIIISFEILPRIEDNAVK